MTSPLKLFNYYKLRLPSYYQYKDLPGPPMILDQGVIQNSDRNGSEEGAEIAANMHYIPYFIPMQVEEDVICTAYPKNWSRHECQYNTLNEAFEAIWQGYADGDEDVDSIIAVTHLPNKRGGVYELRTGKYGYAVPHDDPKQSARLLKENKNAVTYYFDRQALDEVVADFHYAADAKQFFIEHDECVTTYQQDWSDNDEAQEAEYQQARAEYIGQMNKFDVLIENILKTQ